MEMDRWHGATKAGEERVDGWMAWGIELRDVGEVVVGVVGARVPALKWLGCLLRRHLIICGPKALL